MLPAASRLTRPEDFRLAVRRGRRSSRGRLVVHLLTAGPVVHSPVPRCGESEGAGPPRVGLVVPRSVGGAVVRNGVARRLRHLLRERIGMLPGGARVVVRALPAAAHASSAELAGDLDAALGRLLSTRSAT